MPSTDILLIVDVEAAKDDAPHDVECTFDHERVPPAKRMACDATRRLHAHHVIHWLDGGPTELDNLVSVCHFHHHSVHGGGWDVVTDEWGNFTFIDPAGFEHRVPKLNIKSAGVMPTLENGPAEPLAASGERADIPFVAEVILGNTDMRLAQV